MNKGFRGSLGILFSILFGLAISLLASLPAVAQCFVTAHMSGGLCYDWGNRFSGQTIRIFPSGGREVQARTPWGVMYGEWIRPGDAVLDAGDQIICCYGRRTTGLVYGYCNVCG